MRIHLDSGFRVLGASLPARASCGVWTTEGRVSKTASNCRKCNEKEDDEHHDRASDGHR